jgi:hypothetical protein
MPNDLLPISNKAGTINPINGPATYQGQGFLRKSNIVVFVFYKFQN